EAMRLGVHFAIAAGNDGKDACQFSPASTPGAMTVGATDQDDTIASYSNYGPCVAIYAPGSNIVSAWAGSENARHVQSGTSMASPHVAGLMALWMSENPGQVFSVRNMTERILESMTKFSLNGRLVSDVVSYPAKLVSSSSWSSSFSSSSPTSGHVLVEEDVEPTPEDSHRLGGLQRIQDFHGKALARNLVFVGAVAPVQNGEIEEEDTPVASASWTKQPSAGGVGLLAMGVWSVIHFVV
ncbi:serine protease, partial [Mortierella antarctica]